MRCLIMAGMIMVMRIAFTGVSVVMTMFMAVLVSMVVSMFMGMLLLAVSMFVIMGMRVFMIVLVLVFMFTTAHGYSPLSMVYLETVLGR